MSLKSWKKEFYSKDASEFSTLPKATLYKEIEATKHCITKWEGKRHENLVKHKVSLVFRNANEIIDKRSKKTFIYDAETCALCVLNEKQSCCQSCPINRATGKTCLDAFDSTPNVEPMLKVLNDTLVYLEGIKNERTK